MRQIGLVIALASALNGVSAQEPKLSPADMEEDLAILRDALTRLHAGAYRYRSPNEVERLLRDAERRLDHPMSAAELIVALEPVILGIRCGHTEVFQDELTAQWRASSDAFPLQIRFFDHKAVVVLNSSEDRTIAPGTEVLAINGQPMAEIVGRIAPYLNGGDGDSTSRVNYALGRFFAFNYWFRIARAERFEVRVLDRGAATPRVVALNGVREKDLADAAIRNPVNQSLLRVHPDMLSTSLQPELRVLEEQSTALLRIPAFLADPKALNNMRLSAFYREAFERIHREAIATVIVDLRRNGGGDEQLGADLCSYFTNQTFRYFDRIEVRVRPAQLPAYLDVGDYKRDIQNAKVALAPDGRLLLSQETYPPLRSQQGQKNAFSGAVYVLAGGRTYSTAADVVAWLKAHRQAVIIGEDTSGGFAGNNSGIAPKLVLPHSRIKVVIPLMQFWNSVGEFSSATGGVPADHIVRPSVDDLLSGIDTELEFAKSLIGGRNTRVR